MGIRQVPPTIKDPNLAGFLRELRAAIGGVSDQVTKIIQTRSSTGGGTVPTNPTDPTNPTNPVNPVSPTPGDGYPPPPPTSLTATADVWAIQLAWTNPVISDYLGTEVWAKRTFPAWNGGDEQQEATRYYVNAKVLYGGTVYRAKKGNDATDSNAVNNTGKNPASEPDWWEPTDLEVMTDRVLVSEVAGNSYTFTGLTGKLLTPDETWAFWTRNHDTEDLFSTYFPDDDEGVSATTLLDPGAYIDLLTGSITESELYQGLGTRIDRIEEDAAYVAYKEDAKIGYCTIGGSVSSHDTKKDCEDANGTWVDQPFAYAVTQVGVTASNGETATIEEQMESVYGPNGLRSQYTLKIDVAGHVGGFGFATTPNNNSWTSAFGIRADQFFVAPPAINRATAPTSGLYQGMVWFDTSTDTTKYYTGTTWSTTPQALPFIIQASPTTINGELVPAGTYIKDAFIQNGVITSAKIGNAAITNAKIGDFIASTDFTFSPDGSPVMASNTGWCINKDGQAVFNNVRVRGDVLLGGGNLIQNSEALNGLDGHVGSVFNGAVASSTLGNGLASTKPAGSECVVVSSTAGQSTASGWLDFGNPALPGKVAVQPTKYYEFSVYTGAVNCTVSLELIFLSSGGTELGRFNGSTTNASQSSGGQLLSGYKQLVVRGTAPANTAYAVPRLVRSTPTPTTTAAATMYGTRAMLSEVPLGQVSPIPWSPGGISLLDTLGLRNESFGKVAESNQIGSTATIPAGSALTELANYSYAYQNVSGKAITVAVTVMFECPLVTREVRIRFTVEKYTTNLEEKVVFQKTSDLDTRFFTGTALFNAVVPANRAAGAYITVTVRHSSGSDRTFSDPVIMVQEYFR